MIATRFTADQLVLDEVNSGNGKAAERCIEFCKLLQHVYPDARFAVDGKHRDPSNKVDYRGRVDVFVSIDGKWAGRIDVDSNRWGNDLRYTFEGPFVDKGEARYWGDGKVWRKDPVKLVQAIQAQNCLRSENPGELYAEATKKLLSTFTQKLAHLEDAASQLCEAARTEAMTMAVTGRRSPKLEIFANSVESWMKLVDMAQVEMEGMNAELAMKFGVTAWKVDVLDRCPSLKKVAIALR